MGFSLLLAVVIAALLFDYINGFHDAANAIATVVSTGVLPIRVAIFMAGVFNFLGALVGTKVAHTVSTGLVDATHVTQTVLLASLLGASGWSLITWLYGIPSSASHALIGALVGALAAHVGFAPVHWGAICNKVLIPLVTAPLLGFFFALFLMIALLWLVRLIRPLVVHRASRRLQLLSACTMAFSHGSNDAQKSMGIIALSLSTFAAHNPQCLSSWLPQEGGAIPHWVMLSCAAAISLGTLFGGKRIIKTMGSKMIRINPLQGFAAETAGTTLILCASKFGIPLSTTHCINACILGVGASRRLSAVRWGVAGTMVMAWVLTFPLSGLFSFFVMKLLTFFFAL